MTERTSKEAVNQAIADFNSIKEAILAHKIDMPYPTKTSEYAGLIAMIRVGCIAGSAYSEPNVMVSKGIYDNALVFPNISIVNPLVGTAEVINEDE